MKNIIQFLLIFLGFHAIGQKSIIVNGTIIDKETKEPLPFAKIIYPKKSLGVVTYLEGNFYNFYF